MRILHRLFIAISFLLAIVCWIIVDNMHTGADFVNYMPWIIYCVIGGVISLKIAEKIGGTIE